jgi:hypothetical protein
MEIIVNTVIKKKRASTEYNGMELVTAFLLVNTNINNKDELIANMEHEEKYSKIKFNKPEDLNKYKSDLIKKTTILNGYICNFRKNMQEPKLLSDNIQYIYMSGKKNTHSEINNLNKNIEKKAIKSDIYVKLNDDKIVGISVKQSKNATKSNYSVQKMLGKTANVYLKNEKKKYLNENGVTCFNKEQREIVNKLFYPSNKLNSYWSKLREEITTQNPQILNKLTKLLFCLDVPYDVYEYNGSNFTKLNSEINSTIDLLSNASFEEHLPYYNTELDTEREAAKLFYRLVLGEKIFRVEIRWKGNIYGPSPQFQIHEDTKSITPFYISNADFTKQ